MKSSATFVSIRRFARLASVVASLPILATCGDSTAPDPIATKLAIESALSNVVAGAPITLQIELTDDAGNKVANASGSVTVSIAAGSGVAGATLSGTLTATASAGAVTFSGLSINKAGTGYMLTVSAGGLASVTSPAFSVAPGAPSQIAVNGGDTQTGTAGAAVTTAPSAIVQDALGNVVPGVSVTFAVATGGGSVTGASQATNASGIATVGSWILGSTAGSNTLTATFTGFAGTPASFSATGTAGVPTQIAVNGGDSQTAVAGAAVANAPSVIVKDANNNPVSGVSVTFAVASGGGSLTGATTTTNANGVATVGSWTLGTTMGTNSLTATAGSIAPVGITANGTAGGATQIAINAGDAQSATAGAAVANAPSVIVKDANNNVVAGVSVTFAVATGGGSLTGGSQTSNASGVATVGSWTLGATMGANTLSATSGALTGSPITFSATGVAGAATQIAINGGDTQTATAGAAVSTAPNVVVKDANNNVVAGASVTFAVVSGGGSVTGGSQTTNANGVATVGSWTLGATMGANTLSATSGSLAGSPITFSATGVAGAATQIAVSNGDGQSATAGSAVATAPSVVVKDANNNAVAGVSVTFAVASGGGSITGGSQTTNASGVATVGSWTLGTTMGANTLSATSGSLAGSPITFSATGTAGAATQITAQVGDGQTAVAGEAVAVAPSVMVRDANNNVVSGAAVTFAVGLGGGSVTGGSQVTDANGIATVGSWTLGISANPNSLTATSGSLTGSPVTFTAVGVAGAAVQLYEWDGMGETAVAGSAVTTKPAVQVLDANNNPVAGVSVTFAVATGGGSITGASATTDANGRATVGSWTLGTTAGSNTLTAASGTLISSPITFTATGVAGAATQMALHAGNAQTATSGNNVATAPSVIVKDVNNNAVEGVSVTFAVVSGGGFVSQETVQTDASGVAAVEWTLGAIAGANSLTASSSGLGGSPITFTATGAVGTATQMSLSVGDGQTVIAGADVSNPPSVRVTDANGNGVAGVTVTFAVASGGGSVTGGSQNTDDDGYATVLSWTTGFTPGANTLTATAGSLDGSPITFTATGVLGDPFQIIVNAGNNQTGTVAAALATAPSVIVKDAQGHVLESVLVNFMVPPTSEGVIDNFQISTDVNGLASAGNWTLGSTVGAAQLVAFVDLFPAVAVTFNATGTAGAAVQLYQWDGDGNLNTVGTVVSFKPSVLVVDAWENPVAGVSVTFAVASGGGSVTGGSATTDAAGIATVGSWTLGTTAGANSLTATSGTLISSPITFTATGEAGVATQVVVNGDNATNTTVGTVAFTPSVQVMDAHNNPVPGVAVVFAVGSGGGSLTDENQETSVSGIATAGNWTVGTTAGANTLTATVSGLTPVTFTANAIAGAPTQMSLSGGNGQTADAGEPVATLPSVLIKDQYNNPVPGVGVTFAVATGGGNVTGGGAQTNASGVATVGTWTLGDTPGANTLTATLGSITGSPVTFSATGVVGPPAQIVINAGDAQSGTVETGLAIAPSVIVKDAHNNAVSGVAVTFSVPDGFQGSIANGATTTNASGVATAGTWTLGMTAGGAYLNAVVNDNANISLTFNATALAGAAVQLFEWDGQGNFATVGTAVTTNPSVKVVDANNNAVAGVSVTFAVATGGGSLTGGSATTGADGIATVGSWTLGSGAGSNTMTATSGTLISSPITFTATGEPGAATLLSRWQGNNQTAIAGSELPTPITVQVTDAFGNGVPGVSVVFEVAAGSGFIPESPVETGANGLAATPWTISTIAGVNTLNASSDGLLNSPRSFTATGTAGPAVEISGVIGSVQTVIAGADVPLLPTVRVIDANSNGVPGVSVTFAVATGGGSITGGSQTTDADGNASVASWTTGFAPGENTLTATAGSLSGSPVTFTTTGVIGDPYQIIINAGNNQTGTVGTALATAPSVIVKDQTGHVLSGVAVTFAVAPGFEGSIADGATTTNASGVATAGVWSLGTTAGQLQLVASVDAFPVVAVVFTATAQAGAAAAMYDYSGNPDATEVGTAVANKPAVVVTDGYGNPVAGVSVTFAVESGGGSITGGSATTDASGRATVGSWTLGTTSGENTLSATSSGLGSITFTATAQAGAPASFAINANEHVLGRPSAAVSVARPEIIVKDAYGNGVPGASVAFSVASGGGTITGGSVVTGSDGVATTHGWTLGSSATINTLLATATGLSGTKTFSADMLVDVTVGGGHACGKALSGATWCWGSDGNGESGDGPTIGFHGRVTGGLTFASVQLGKSHSCGLTAAGAAWCWGSGGDGRLGNGDADDRDSPTAVSGGLTFASIAPGERHTCALTTAGTAYCWGHGGEGRLGNDATDDSSEPVPVSGGLTFASIDAGGTHTCAVTSAGVGYCWGNGNQRGDSQGGTSNVPSPVAGGHTWAKIATGRDHSCGITTSGVAYCWGSGNSGQLGLGPEGSTNVYEPNAVVGGLTFQSINTGPESNTTCGIVSGAAYCWGFGANGELGIGNNSDSSSPVAVSGGLTFTSIATGSAKVCGKTTNIAAVQCWGIGTGSATDINSLVPVPIP
jgi:adhesin/invasin